MDTSLIHKIDNLAIELANDSPIPANKLIRLAEDICIGELPITAIHSFLDLAHFPGVNKSINNSSYLDRWFTCITALIRKSHYHFGMCFFQRSQRYSEKTLFQIPHGNEIETITYSEAWNDIKRIGAGLHSISTDTKHAVIGIYSVNSLHGALTDLACLCFGDRVVPIPGNLPFEHFKYIVSHAGITHLFIDGNEQIEHVKELLKTVDSLTIVSLNDSVPNDHYDLSWQDFLSLSDQETTVQIPQKLDMDSCTSIMYTSGTTSDPKGIIFTPTNIICKRFARALALPEISSADRFLCYLPLYHTFGRFFELTGTIFWGATYFFAQSPSYKALIKDFKRCKPTVFISIPKRWKQLYEQAIENQSQTENGLDVAKKKIDSLTGGNLVWGLSAAGYLDPAIFEFFHQCGIQLLSGYGMTEATGGILMTPPGDYMKDSVGKPLPGIEATISNEGELLIRGPYISPGYFPDDLSVASTEAWFQTGDIFTKRKNHYFIIDRIKEIYKNNRGQTIAPQKIENMFTDFESIQSAFLVGDGREYNSVLLYPDWKLIPQDIDSEDIQSVKDYFDTLVQSVNSFLAPYERIVNYEIIQRDFSSDFGETTPKNTFKRKQILSNFNDVIEKMYLKDYVSLFDKENEIRIPLWILREKGILGTDLIWNGDHLVCGKTDAKIRISFSDTNVRIGNFYYVIHAPFLDINQMIRIPALWLGNRELIDFIGPAAFRIHREEKISNIDLLDEKSFCEQADPIGKQNEISQFDKHSLTLESVHISAIELRHTSQDRVVETLQQLSNGLKELSGDLHYYVKKVILRLQYHPTAYIRLKSLESIISLLTGNEFILLLIDYLRFVYPSTMDDRHKVDPNNLSLVHANAVLNYLRSTRKQYLNEDDIQTFILHQLIQLIAEYGEGHPSTYIEIRAELNWWQLFGRNKILREFATKSQNVLLAKFRNWLGSNMRVAIDPESGTEYGWGHVIDFDTETPQDHQSLLLRALSDSTLLREAIFIFSKKQMVQLNDIPINGIWISLLGQRHGKSVYRLLVQTRMKRSYNFVININENLKKSFIEDEIKWLILMAQDEHGRKLVEDFGGYWSDFSMYTEEYIPGETVIQYLDRHKTEIASGRAIDRWQMRWLHFFWNGCMAYIDFWVRSEYTFSIANPSPNNLIIPEYDYTSGTRLISISDRIENDDIVPLLFGLYEQFLLSTENEFDGLSRMSDWEIIFTSLLQVVTVKKGLELLKIFNKKIESEGWQKKAEFLGLTTHRVHQFISEINELGVMTKQVTFAALRYNRWLDLNPQATKEARATVLLELYKDYQLRDFIEDYPETRIRFFLMTCFKNSSAALQERLLDLQKQVRAKTITSKDLDTQVKQLDDTMDLTAEDQYFLTRLLFEHVQASDYGNLVSWDVGHQGRLDLITIVEDAQGERYRIRPPFHPKEIAQFHTILNRANMKLSFHEDHKFLLLFSAVEQVLGGIFWKNVGDETAYLERIVIKRNYQKRGISTVLLNEFFQRLIHLGFNHLTVGFFQAGLFYKYGFAIEKQFGGLVKHLKK